MRFDPFLLIFPAMFFAIMGFLIYRLLWLRKLRRQNFDWYRSNFPALFAKGKVICHRCNSSNIGTERLMQGTYLRAHVCRNCGTNLYYSKER